MANRTTTLCLLLVLGACTAEPAGPAAQGLGSEGFKYEHRMERSRFNVGANARHEVEGPYERVLGDKGAFFIDTVTGATLAVRNAVQASAYPQPLTNDPSEHNAEVYLYLVGAGIPAGEVGGMHVTTTMAGGGPVDFGIQPSRSRLLWYTTHLERSLGGIPVEGSLAFAALDSQKEVIGEGVYWPAIPAGVVTQARALKLRLGSSSERAAFMDKVRAARPEVGNVIGEVKIAHTSAGHHGKFEARAVYSVIVRSPSGGKARIARFDDSGAPVVMADELPSARDSLKQQ